MVCNKKTYLSLALAFGWIFCAFAQDQAQVEYYNAFDEKVGIENTGLYQGILYLEKYRTINEQTQFFKTRDFLKGHVCYDGQCYYDLDLKYDVFEDEVLLKLITKAGGGTIKLFKEYVDSFEIDGTSFVKIEEKDIPSLNAYGFYAVALQSSIFTLYTKYNKKDFERKDRSSVYYEFLDGPSEHVLLYNGAYHTLNSKKDAVQLFPELKRDIDKFYGIARSLRKSDPNGFQVSLLRRIEILLNQSKPIEE
ncbi:hypothetical protein [Flagellimonas nanhaiensis]|uniref:Uncharacterized protein n=1 Tax=Flagellimonas nanhaiensis TaxID=2292706 RepID=A0A371JUC4_9FLAO|nr:hypothetical protein [Allomuricauda nanhaiensis]RDY61408.1 hypothetical protein DX873_04410 [Allomuricauda nanhaiensis]